MIAFFRKLLGLKQPAVPASLVKYYGMSSYDRHMCNRWNSDRYFR